MPPVAKKHLPFNAWPLEDRALWARSFEQDGFDDKRLATHLASATKIGLRTSYARYLGFLANHEPVRLQLPAETRIDPDSIKAFVEHLRQSCRDTSITSLLHKLRLTLGFICPKHDWSWLKLVAKRIHAGAVPRGDATRGVTSPELYAIGIAMMTTAEAALVSSDAVSLNGAVLYRDGLIIALLALAPLRRRTLAALSISKHLVKIGECWLLDIPAADTKTRRPLEFPLSNEVSRRISLYLDRFRPIFPYADHHDGLWPSTRGRPMDGGSMYDAVRRRTTEVLGFSVNLHRFRLAAGNFWSIADPTNVQGVKDLLGQTSFRTTEKHYIGAQSRLAGRALARLLRPSRY